MADIAHSVGGDLSIGSTGDLTVVVDSDATAQAVQHRLLTAPGSYIWQLAYGAGLPAVVGSVVSSQQISAIIRAELQREASVAKIPQPSISVTANTEGLTMATIAYVDAASNSPVTQNIVLER